MKTLATSYIASKALWPFRKRLTRQSRHTKASLERLILLLLTLDQALYADLRRRESTRKEVHNAYTALCVCLTKNPAGPVRVCASKVYESTSLKEAEEETGQFGRLHLCLRFWCYGLTGNVN